MRVTTYNVTDRRVIWDSGATITGNENVDKFHFVFDSEWDSFSGKFLVLIVNGTSYIDQLDAENNVILRDIVYDQENVEFGVFGIQTGQESARLSTDIVAIETIPSIWGRIRDVSDLPDKTQWEIYTEEMLALLAEGQITLEACQQALTDALSAKDTTEGYKNNTKGYMETTEGYKDTTKGYMDTTEGYKRDTAGLKQDTINIVTEFNSNVEQKTTDFNNNASSKTTAFNNNASSKTNDFNSNYTDKLGTFNSNATSKTTDFNDNASSKTTTFNSNATNKTTAFNNNASSKTDDYNSNATSKTTAFNENYTEKYNAVTLAGTTAVGNVQTAENTAITNIETAGSSYDARINDLLDQIPVGTVEDTDINVQDSSDLPLKDTQVEGNTYQLQTTGKNKLDSSVWLPGYIDSSGVYHAANTNATFDSFIVVNPSTVYTVSANKNVRSFSISEYDSTQTFIRRTQSSFTVSNYTVTTDSNTKYVKISFNYDNSTVITQNIIDTLEIQLETGSSRTTYEPYTCGQPSPNPDYPQNISVVTGDNTVNVVGKNICNIVSGTKVGQNGSTKQSKIDINNNIINLTASVSSSISSDFSSVFKINNELQYAQYSSGTFSGQGTKLYPGTYTLCYKKISGKSSATNTGNNQFSISIKNKTGVEITRLQLYNKTEVSYTFTIEEEIEIDLLVTVYANSQNSPTIDYDINFQLQLISGSIANYDFKLYTSQSQLLSLGNIELAKIGEYKDKLFKAVNGDKVYDSLDSTTKASLTYGSWYKHKAVRKINMWEYNYTNGVTKRENTILFYGSFSNKANSYILSNMFTDVGYTGREADTEFVANGGGYNQRFYISINKSRLDGYTDDLTNAQLNTLLKSWLEDNNAYAYFGLLAPVDEEITDTTLLEQLNNLLNMSTYKNITNIFTTTDNEEPILNVTYRKDLQTLTDKIALLEARVELLES